MRHKWLWFLSTWSSDNNPSVQKCYINTRHLQATHGFCHDQFIFLINRPPGLCLEKVPAASPSLSNKNTGSPASNRSVTDRDQEIITCYEKSGDIALLYLQEAEKVCVWGCETEELGSWMLTKYLVSAWKRCAVLVGVW